MKKFNSNQIEQFNQQLIKFSEIRNINPYGIPNEFLIENFPLIDIVGILEVNTEINKKIAISPIYIKNLIKKKYKTILKEKDLNFIKVIKGNVEITINEKQLAKRFIHINEKTHGYINLATIIEIFKKYSKNYIIANGNPNNPKCMWRLKENLKNNFRNKLTFYMNEI